MRVTAIMAAVFFCVVIFPASSKPVSANALSQLTAASSINIANDLTAFDLIKDKKNRSKEPTKPKTASPKPPKHTVGKGESLTTIARRYQTSWQRLFDKNTQVKNPDVIEPEDKLVIPLADEKLAAREMPAQPVVESPEALATSPTRSRSSASAPSISRSSAAGNRYVRGYCTWYAKNRRPDLPNNLGNANTWVARAHAQGRPTGRTPRAGAIGQQGMHVVYVERVNGNGTVTVSEMNFKGFGVVSTRTVPASAFQYIY